MQQVLVVVGVHFDQHVILSSGEMALYNFRYVFQVFYKFVKFVGFFEEYTHKSASVVA